MKPGIESEIGSETEPETEPKNEPEREPEKNHEEYDTSDKEEWQDASDLDWENYAKWNEESSSAEEADKLGWLPLPGTTTESEEEDVEERHRRERHEAFMEEMDRVLAPHPPQHLQAGGRLHLGVEHNGVCFRDRIKGRTVILPTGY